MAAPRGEDLVVLVGGAAGKTWWRNLDDGPRDVTVRRDGRDLPRRARLLRAGDPGRDDAAAAYRAAFPRVAVAPGDPLVVLEPVGTPRTPLPLPPTTTRTGSPMSTSTSDRVRTPARPPRAFTRRLAAAGLPTGPVPADPVTEADLAGLPSAAVRYVEAMGVFGQPRTWSLQAHFTGRFRRRADGPWMRSDAWQYNTGAEVARLYRMRLLVGGVVPMWGWDTYRAGTGRMLGKALGLVTVADGSGPEFDCGELVTWLDDAVLLAPAMLLHPRVRWEDRGEDRFAVSVTDGGRTVSAVVALDGLGRPADLWTEDRWADLPGGPVRTPWSTPVRGWAVADGRPRLVAAAAVWHLPDGDLTYAEMTLADLDLDVPPGR
jgi:hypothetical protein